MNEFELPFWDNNELVIGIDEVGRGPICGPLVVSGVILPINYENSEIKDSKKLTHKKITKLYKEIIEVAKFHTVKIVDPKEIDELNIYQATKKAMEEIALEAITNNVLVDAMKIDSAKNVNSIIKGDSKSISIAAASIVAKYTRDEIMFEYDKLFPEYGLKDHKGYPTKKHLEAIKVYGIKDFYRLSYRPCQEVIELNLFNQDN